MIDNNIPESFKIANQTITVEIVKSIDNNDYGYFCDATNTIVLAKTLKVNDNIINLTQEQIKNTFWHEVFHAFQFYFNNKYDEAQSQVYANFMCEFIESTTKPF